MAAAAVVARQNPTRPQEFNIADDDDLQPKRGVAAAAAAVVFRQNTTRSWSSRSPARWRGGRRRSKQPGDVGICATCVLTFISVGLTVTGVVLLATSVRNRRNEMVSDYNSWLSRWRTSGRPNFARLRSVNVTAVFGRDGLNSRTMDRSEVAEWSLVDTEDGMGITEEYQSLKYVTVLQFPSYYDKIRGEEALDLPLSYEEAHSAASFSFDAEDESGTRSSFKSPVFPLVYSKAVTAMSPGPQVKCRGTMHGVWLDGRCYQVQRLTQLCLQVLLAEDGAWVLHHEARGCDPRKDWHPALYEADRCWGPNPARGCTQLDEDHFVQVMLRSAEDPFLRAEELTDDQFDFGASAATQRAFGGVVLAIGCCLSILPCIQLYMKYYGVDDEEIHDFTTRRGGTSYGRSLEI